MLKILSYYILITVTVIVSTGTRLKFKKPPLANPNHFKFWIYSTLVFGENWNLGWTGALHLLLGQRTLFCAIFSGHLKGNFNSLYMGVVSQSESIIIEHLAFTLIQWDTIEDTIQWPLTVWPLSWRTLSSTTLWPSVWNQKTRDYAVVTVTTSWVPTSDPIHWPMY